MALNSQPKLTPPKVIIGLYKVALGIYAVIILANISLISTSSAATGNATATITDQLCLIYSSAGYLVGVLTALFIVWGGISYALSMGNDKGDLSVGNAKAMIVSALTGMFLYMMGYVLLGVCTAAGGGILRNLLS